MEVKLTACDVPMVRVVWLDPHGAAASGWTDTGEILLQVPGHAETCGFLIQSTDDQDAHIKVALCLDFETGHLDQFIAIPKKLIKSMHLLTIGESCA